MDESFVIRCPNDLVVSICQDNNEKNVIIKGCNQRTIDLLGYTKYELIDQGIDQLFSQTVIEIIDTHIDYSDSCDDIGVILSKIRNCTIKDKYNKSIDVKLKSFRTVSENNRLFFELLIRDFNFIDKINRFRENTIDYSSYRLTPQLNIIDRSSIIQEVNALQQFHNLNGGDSVVGIIVLNDALEKDYKNLKSILKAYESCTREYDIIGYLDDNSLLFLILNYTPQGTNNITNKIYNKISTVVDNKDTVTLNYTNLMDCNTLIGEYLVNNFTS